MKRLAILFLLAVTAAPLAGCVVAPGPCYHCGGGGYWVPGHYGPYGHWVPGHWQ
jgi:hypothetical protein